MRIPNNIAIIPDGNRRRWAGSFAVAPSDTYLPGAEKGLEVMQWCQEIGIGHVSFFGASHENILERTSEEVRALFRGALAFCQGVVKSGAALHIFGDIAGMSWDMPGRADFLKLWRLGKTDSSLVVHVGVNYAGSQDWIGLAFRERPSFGSRRNIETVHQRLISAGVPDVDLLIRTGGKQRLSNFLLLQLRYTELCFLPVLWPDFLKINFQYALSWFDKQDRNFGE